jgi:Carboxypeptidase regulatory-like domain
MTGIIALALFVQQAAGSTLRVTVIDQTNAVVVGATVTVVGADDATKARTIEPVKTIDTGVAIVPALVPGRYTVEVEFPGFEKRVLNDVRVRPGDNRQVAMLAIQRMEASVNVEQDKQQAASDRNGPSFGTTLTRDQIDALSDDPAMLQQQLQEMAGPGAVIRIDGFEGGALPPKAMIRSIRIARDQFAAEFHTAGGVSIEIITQPGVGPLRYFSNLLIRDGGLSGRSPFVPVKGPEENVNYGFGLGGTVVQNKSSFFINAFGISAYDTPNLNTAVPGGTVAHALNLHAPRDNIFVNGQMDYAVTLDQTLRFGYNLTHVANDNLGVGGYDEPERAYSTSNAVHTFRFQHFGPIGRRAFWRSRVQFVATDTTSDSATETATIRVLDAFTSGGAQRTGGDHAKAINVASDFDYVRGRNSIRTGLVLDSAAYHSDSAANYLGTYTFANLQSFQANQPINYSRRIGDPNIAYANVQVAIYVQDDVRVRKNLTLTPGVRYELQNHVSRYTNFGPRFGVTYAPAASGQTTLRSSVGVFYDWLPASTYDQVVRVDGFHQREINIIDPSYPDVPVNAIVPPVNRYLLGDSFATPRITRVSAGIDQTVMKVTRVSATYSYQRGSRLARGENLNVPIGGVRPDSSFANIIEVVSDAASIQHQLQLDATINPGALLQVNRNAPRISWKRSTVFANYTLGSIRNNTDGPFSVPPTGTLATEWGPSVTAAGGGGFGQFVPGVIAFGGGSGGIDVRHRMNVSFNNQIVRNLLLAVNVNASSAPPYTLLTGLDTNGDGIFNDRPAGVGRSTLRASGQVNVNTMFGYVFTFGRATNPGPPGIGVFGGGAATQVRTIEQTNTKYRLQIFVQAQNITNERNYLGYSGTLTSPFFGRPTTVSGMRKIDIGMGLSF